MRFCINCGQQIPEGVRFCPKCGTEQVAQAPTSIPEPKPEVQQPVQPQMNQQPVQPQVSQQQYQPQATPEPKPEVQSQTQPQQVQPQMSQQPVQPQANQQQYQQNFNQQQQYSQSQNNYAGSESQANLGQPYHLNFSQSVKYIFDHMFEFSPDVQDNQKSIFWWNMLVLWIFDLVVLSILGLISPVLSILGSIASYVLIVASTMRRLNYLGKNRNLAWLMFVPFVNLYPAVLMFTDKKV